MYLGYWLCYIKQEEAWNISYFIYLFLNFLATSYSMWDLRPWPEIEPTRPKLWKHGILTTELVRKFLKQHILNQGLDPVTF